MAKAKRAVAIIEKVNGRPTKYDAAYCEQLIDHMKGGLSFESFAGKIGVSRDTLYEWAKVHPIFSDSIKRAKEMSLLRWEQYGVEGMTGEIQGFNAAVYIFTMKNRFKWTDRTEVESTNTNINTPELSREQMLEKAKAIVKALEAPENTEKEVIYDADKITSSND